MSDQQPPGSSEAAPGSEEDARVEQIVASLFVLAALLAAGLLVVYLRGGDTQLEGLLLFGAFGALGTGLGIWVRRLAEPVELVEERYPAASEPDEREAFEAELEHGLGEARPGGRRRFLAGLALGSSGVLGLALAIPLRSLGPGPENELFQTAWRPGRRLVDLTGEPIRPEDVVVDQIVTVLPEGSTEAADAQAVLIGLRPQDFAPHRLPAETVENIVCYSKICTHAGCPVGLYRARVGQLLCPCHQSLFDVNRAATPISGPAARPLPQLPLSVDEQGFLVAAGGFTEPVGPSFWNLTHEPDLERP